MELELTEEAVVDAVAMSVPGSGSRPVGGTFVYTALSVFLVETVVTIEAEAIKVIVELSVVELVICVGSGPIMVLADKLELVDSVSVSSSSSVSEGVLDSPSGEVVGWDVAEPAPVGMY